MFLAAFFFSIIFSLIPDHNPHVVEHIPHPARRFTSLTSCPHQHDSGIMEVINLRVLFLPVCWGYNGNGAVQGDAICRCTHAGHPIMIFYLVVALSPTLCSSCAASLHSLCTYIRYLSFTIFGDKDENGEIHNDLYSFISHDLLIPEIGTLFVLTGISRHFPEVGKKSNGGGTLYGNT